MTDLNQEERWIEAQPNQDVETMSDQPEPGEQPARPGGAWEKADLESELEALQKELEQLRTQSQDYLDGWQRARAELANARRRFEKERAEAGQYANADLLRRLLPVGDDFERALATIPDGIQDQPWLEGISMIQRKLYLAFESAGVLPIEARPGDPFDPTIHEALSHEEAEERQSGEIIAEVQKGYLLGASVLRPALVRVAK